MGQDQFWSIHKLHHTFVLYTNIPLDQTSKRYSGRVISYMLMKFKEELWIF